jgi:hypothetical protein
MRRFAANGYEVLARENEILFVDRRTWGLGWAMLVLAVVVTILIVLSGLSLLAKTESRSSLASIAMPTSAALLLVVIWLMSIAYRARRNQPVEENQDNLTLDRSSQALRDARGGIVSQFTDVKARMHIDWWTRGTMRLVILSWLGGRRTIYRTFGRRRSLELLAFLKEQGLDAL